MLESKDRITVFLNDDEFYFAARWMELFWTGTENSCNITERLLQSIHLEQHLKRQDSTKSERQDK